MLYSENTKHSSPFEQTISIRIYMLIPFRLGQLCTQTIQSLFNGNLPDDLNRFLKLLSKLNPGKSAWPDLIKPIVLKELRVEIAPVICLLFDRSLQTGQLPSSSMSPFQEG